MLFIVTDQNFIVPFLSLPPEHQERFRYRYHQGIPVVYKKKERSGEQTFFTEPAHEEATGTKRLIFEKAAFH